MRYDVSQQWLDLLRRIQAQDQQALGLLYDQLAPLVHTLILRILGDPADAEDVLLETFWHIWHGAASYDPLRGTVEGWVITLARSRALDHLRTHKRRALAATESRSVQPSCEPSPPTTPEDCVLQGERARAVSAALAALPAEQRLVLELAYYHGLSQTEMAQRLTQPLGTIKTRVRAGLLRLRQVLRPYLGVSS
jgi:RNA polymerase sigma-70 factor (ECF subfamily)